MRQLYAGVPGTDTSGTHAGTESCTHPGTESCTHPGTESCTHPGTHAGTVGNPDSVSEPGAYTSSEPDPVDISGAESEPDPVGNPDAKYEPDSDPNRSINLSANRSVVLQLHLDCYHHVRNRMGCPK